MWLSNSKKIQRKLVAIKPKINHMEEIISKIEVGN